MGMSKYCPSCGEEINDNAEFCPECGTDIEAVASGEEEAKPNVAGQEDSESDDTMKYVIYGTAGLILLMGLGLMSDGVVLGGLIFASTGLFTLPQVRDKISESQDISFSKYAVVGIIIVGVVAGSAFVPSDYGDTTDSIDSNGPENTEPTNTENQNQQSDGNEQDSTGGSTTDYVSNMRDSLESEGISVDYFSEDAGTVFLEYVSTETTEEGIAGEIGTVAGVYRNNVVDGWDVDSLEVTVLDSDEFPVGSYYIESQWVEELNSGEITQEEFLQRITDTIMVQDTGGTSGTDTGGSEYTVRVEYSGSWTGAVSAGGNTRSTQGQGTTEIEISGSPSIISANAQKQEANRETLRIQILEDGTVVSESQTSAEYGVAQTSHSVGF